jgi:hypothetical protein
VYLLSIVLPLGINPLLFLMFIFGFFPPFVIALNAVTAETTAPFDFWL